MDVNYVVAQAYLMGLRADSAERRRARQASSVRPGPARTAWTAWTTRLRQGWAARRRLGAAGAGVPADVVCLRAAAGARA